MSGVLPTSLIILKNSIIEGRVPTSSNLEVGELALGLFKGQESIWAKNSSGEIVDLRSPRHDLMWGDLFKSFDTREEFQKALSEGKVLNTSIVFIKSEELIWTGGIYYGNSGGLTLEDVISYISTILIKLPVEVFNLNNNSLNDEISGAFGGINNFLDIFNKTISGNALSTLMLPSGGSTPVSIISKRDGNKYIILIEYFSLGNHIITEITLAGNIFTINKQSIDLNKLSTIDNDLAKLEKRVEDLENIGGGSGFFEGFLWTEETIN